MKPYLIEMPDFCKPADCMRCSGREYIDCPHLPQDILATAIPLVEVERPNRLRIDAVDGSETFCASAQIQVYVRVFGEE